MRRYYCVLMLFVVLVVQLLLLHPSHATAQPPQQYPIMDKVAAKIIAKYQNSTCNDLYQQKSQKATKRGRKESCGIWIEEITL